MGRGKDREDLKKALDDASSQTRNLLITFLLFVFYVFVSAAGTTHRMLFMPNSIINLPFLTIGLPIKVFYFVAPLLILVIHFDLLFNLKKHSEKLREWFRKGGGHLSLYPFIFNFLRVKSETTVIRGLLISISWLLVVVAPLVTLLYVQIIFLPYHSRITYWHIFAVILDGIIIFLFGNRIITEKGLWQKVVQFLTLFLTLSVTLIARPTNAAGDTLVEIPKKYFPRTLNWARNPGEEKPEAMMVKIKCPFDRSLDLHEQTLLGTEPGDAVIAYFLAKEGKKDRAYLELGERLDLKGRDFRYAKLSHVNLTKADLRYADLEGADFTNANLQGANLSFANLREAILSDANLQRVHLGVSNLQRANLTSANLQGANFSLASLQGANLKFASLQGASLSIANLQGADLTGANLQGANLRKANLQMANFNFANLQGADLASTKLQLANLGGSKLDGALFAYSSLGCSKFDHDILHGAIFFENYVEEPNWEDIGEILKNVSVGEKISFKDRIKDEQERCKHKQVEQTILQKKFQSEKFIKARLELACQYENTARLYYEFLYSFSIDGLLEYLEHSEYVEEQKVLEDYKEVMQKIEEECPQFIQNLF